MIECLMHSEIVLLNRMNLLYRIPYLKNHIILH